MKYLNELLLFWFCANTTYIVWTNPQAHEEFIVMATAMIGLYKYMQDREDKIYGVRTQG